ncbi:sensor histidine kinase [Microbacterium sp. MYb62]|uniref:sensor histidine kinase n=1 Tax=Microbacterium sp. MYb62 TaxID=1848690 RepID=UPI0015E406A5|nr:histidine kinase [Microbacterium sp. MYb62]
MWSETSATSPGRHAWLRVDLIVALIALVVLLPSSIALLTEPATRPDPPLLATVIGLCLILHVATFVAIRRPVLAAVIANAAMFVLVLVSTFGAASTSFLPSSVAYLLVIAQVAAQSSRTFRILALAAGIFGAALIAFAEPQFDDLRLGAFAGLSGAIAAAWAMGLVLRVRRDQAEERTNTRVAQAISDERARINRDLHDVVAHAMTVMIAQAEVARAVREDDPHRSDAALTIVVDTGRTALRGMRSVVADDAPLEPLPTVDSLGALVESVRTPSVQARLEESGARGDLRADAALALHHAVREALTNAVRHTAPPVDIEVRLEWQQGAVHATVRDDGGSGTVLTDLGSGIGLIGIAERVRLAGGVLTTERRAPRGWTLRVELPVERSPA